MCKSSKNMIYSYINPHFFLRAGTNLVVEVFLLRIIWYICTHKLKRFTL